MPETRKLIVSGGFRSADLALARYILEQAAKQNPRVGCLATASGDADPLLVRFYTLFSQLRCRPSHLPLFSRTPELGDWVADQQVIFVTGGNTKSMLGVWREWGLPALLRRAWESGTVLAGFSAGAICWFRQGISDSWVDDLRPIDGLGFLPGSCCPHYDSESERRPIYHRLITSGQISEGVALEDGAALHYLGEEPVRIAASRKGAQAFAVERSGENIVERELEIERLDLA